VCGEAAADPDMIPLLAGLDVDELSVAPGAVAAVVARTRTLDLVTCRDLARRALAAVTLAEVRAIVDGQARD
jgi:phosphocarrier protein FPr